MPCVGDWVVMRQHNEGSAAVIEKVLPRRTFLQRKSPGASFGAQLIAANLDAVFIIQSCAYDFNPNRLERALVIAAHGGVAPVVLLTKTDLVTAAERGRLLCAIEAVTDARCLTLSNVTGEGIDALRSCIGPGRTYCLLGSSGVGKTTLINRLVGRCALRTGAVSSTGEGTHTTTRRQLVTLEGGGLLIDTPGMREFGLADAETGIDAAFDSFTRLAAMCRYSDCRHVTEPGCAVLAAVESGEISRQRYENYLKLRKESENYATSEAERRRKEKSLTRHIRHSKKLMSD